jgi:hypothetical protein
MAELERFVSCLIHERDGISSAMRADAEALRSAASGQLSEFVTQADLDRWQVKYGMEGGFDVPIRTEMKRQEFASGPRISLRESAIAEVEGRGLPQVTPLIIAADDAHEALIEEAYSAAEAAAFNIQGYAEERHARALTALMKFISAQAQNRLEVASPTKNKLLPVPTDPDELEVWQRLRNSQGNGKSDNEIARHFHAIEGPKILDRLRVKKSNEQIKDWTEP